jgi:hypothetical protein
MRRIRVHRGALRFTLPQVRGHFAALGSASRHIPQHWGSWPVVAWNVAWRGTSASGDVHGDWTPRGRERRSSDADVRRRPNLDRGGHQWIHRANREPLLLRHGSHTSLDDRPVGPDSVDQGASREKAVLEGIVNRRIGREDGRVFIRISCSSSSKRLIRKAMRLGRSLMPQTEAHGADLTRSNEAG